MTDSERAVFRANIDAALASFKMKSGWRGLSAEQAVEAFSYYIKNDHELSWGDPSLTDRTWALNMLLNTGFTRGMIEERSGDPLQVTSEMGNVLMEIDESLDGTGGLCPGVFWFHDSEYDLFTVIDNRGDECRMTRFIEERNCMNFLDGLNPMRNWDTHSFDPEFDAKVNKLAAETECPIMPDQDLSEWDMARYGYEREGMLPVGAERAEVLFGRAPLHQLHPDGFSSPVMSMQDVKDHANNDGLFGVTLVDWMDHLAESGVINVETTPRWRAMNTPLNDLLKEAKDRATCANHQGQGSPRKPPEMDR